MSILKTIEFATSDDEVHSLSINDARSLYKELHELFGEKTTLPNAPLTTPLWPNQNIGTTGPTSTWATSATPL